MGQPISEVGAGTTTVFGMDVLTYPAVDPIVLEFPISLAIWNGVAESIDFGSASRRKLGKKILGDACEHP